MADSSVKRPCWPIVWLWVSCIAQYAYRYILQVNDPRTSVAYASTPPALSAIKYGIFVVFASYGLFRLARRPISLSPSGRTLLYITGAAVLILAAIILIRVATLPGDLSETMTCAAQLVPWMATVFVIPLVFTSGHSLARTLLAFERLIFWIVFPFWLLTVALVIAGVRYPALSYPGVIVRFGGILDDPNGYACLCLFLLVVCLTNRARAGKLKAFIYGIMLVCTLSLTGCFTALITGLILLWSRLRRPGSSFGSTFTRFSIASAASICLLVVVIAVDNTDNTVVAAVNTLYSAKNGSATTHLSNIAPDPAMLDVSSPFELLLGTGGFSENLYWRLLLNFGWIGLAVVVGVLASWLFYGLRSARKCSDSLQAWYIAVLVGSSGIAYLLVFPVNIIYWSSLALLIQANAIHLPLLETPRDA